MKTPEEIKKGLEVCCADDECQKCPYIDDDKWSCGIRAMMRDALAYIAQLEAERDAAIKDIPRACGYCKHYYNPPVFEETALGIKVSYCEKDCYNVSEVNAGWEWRGAPPKEDDHENA